MDETTKEIELEVIDRWYNHKPTHNMSLRDYRNAQVATVIFNDDKVWAFHEDGKGEHKYKTLDAAVEARAKKSNMTCSMVSVVSSADRYGKASAFRDGLVIAAESNLFIDMKLANGQLVFLSGRSTVLLRNFSNRQQFEEALHDCLWISLIIHFRSQAAIKGKKLA